MQRQNDKWNEITATKLATYMKRSGHSSLNKVGGKAIPESSPWMTGITYLIKTAKWTMENDLTINW